MKNIFSSELIILDSNSSNQQELFEELAGFFVEKGYASDKDQLIRELKQREETDPTLIAEHIAMPHTKSTTVITPGVIIARTKKDIEWISASQETARLFFMIVVPAKDVNTHINIISGLSEVLGDESVIDKVMNSLSPEEIVSFFNTASKSKNEETSVVSGSVDIVAVTACPTGIAHTYMAAEALLKEAQNKKLNIRVETNGSDGPKNILTKQEISTAKVVIVAADREVDLSRFDGKKLYSVGAGETVRNAAKVIEQASLDSVPTYTHAGGQSSQVSRTSKGVYGQLMTGVSYMLPFVVGGGILIALGFMFGITSHDPNTTDYSPIAQFLNTLGGAGAFSLMVPVLAAYIGFSIGERPALMPAMVGGLLANQNGGGFLGGLLAGFAGGHVILLLKKLFSYLPKALDGLKPVLFYPVFGLLLTGMIVVPMLSFVSDINTGVSDFLRSLEGGNLVFLGLILGGMMAVDMGGPINKAAFTFGIAAIAAESYFPHAAVMAGGMVPPLGIALATTFAKKLFTQSEREAGMACYALGASFITEGAIPFAASHPLIVIPSSVIGSAIAGALSVFFGCQLPAPHGGIFVFPLITNVGMYIFSILVGSIITASSITFFLSKKQK